MSDPFWAFFAGMFIAAAYVVLLVFLFETSQERWCEKTHNVYDCERLEESYVPVSREDE